MRPAVSTSVVFQNTNLCLLMDPGNEPSVTLHQFTSKRLPVAVGAFVFFNDYFFSREPS